MESITVIDVGCRFPSPNNPEIFCKLRNKIDAIALN